MLKTAILSATGLFVVIGAASAADVTALKPPALPLGSVSFPNGKSIDLSVGFGSGAYHRPGDPENVFYTITDRGPNIDCKGDAKKLIGLDEKAMCDGNLDGKVFPQPGFTPTIYQMTIGDDGAVSVTETTPLRGQDGKLLSGLPNPLTGTTTEAGYSPEGKKITSTPNGFDSEAIARLADGSYWIGEEYGVSIAHVAADGKVLERLVPAGLESDYAGADYPVKGALPAILMKRKLNRGIEGLSASPDGSTLYFSIQSPLANPDNAAYKKSRTVRIFKFDPKSEKVLGEYAYPLDEPATFKADSAKKTPKQSSVKVSELTALGHDQLLVLERISRTTKLYKVDLAAANPVPTTFDDAALSPSLEQLAPKDLAAAGVAVLSKTLVLDSDDLPGMPEKIEGVAVMDPSTLILTTDNDFGIAGADSAIVKVHLDKPLAAVN
ncbi:esterase-like activity of phytase family protein [Breoghania sp. JC706]|uniref:esterase-like activity of phytase family protein n=1 Tax=Breoghania sp. JC706 TaxID=3117732 RepID=UPI0030098A83